MVKSKEPNAVRIQITPKKGQYIITIPKPLAKAFKLRKYQLVRWTAENGDLVARVKGR